MKRNSKMKESPFDEKQLIENIKRHAVRIDCPTDLDLLIEDIGDAKYVLLGEASHGTSEFYTYRTEITKRLIETKGFTFVAVEGDFPACFEVNSYIKGQSNTNSDTASVLQVFKRWPSWMWANSEIVSLVNWMKDWNETQRTHSPLGFYGLDMYSLWESMGEILRYLQSIESEDLEAVKKAFACFEPFGQEGQNYGISAAFFAEHCEEEVIQLLLKMQEHRLTNSPSSEEALSAEMNALVAVHAEQYYRSMVQGGPESWNIRDRHMVEAFQRILKFHGTETKAIIWEHNTHIGDARATDMQEEDMINVGQLIREHYPQEDVYALGFGTYSGSVIAARAWGDPLEILSVPNAMQYSWEHFFHQAGAYDQLLLLRSYEEEYQEKLGHRAIGVVYHPEDERGNYVPTQLSKRYDAFFFVEKSHALHPLTISKVLI